MIPARRDLLQFVRYLAVGGLNTLVTLLAIYVCKSFLDINPWVSNAIGYVAGVINSFVWNRCWVFNSHSRRWTEELVVFLIGFAVCYGAQFLCTWLMDTYVIDPDFELHILSLTFSGYGIATLVGMMVYTIANFIYNRLFTFRSTSM